MPKKDFLLSASEPRPRPQPAAVPMVVSDGQQIETMLCHANIHNQRERPRRVGTREGPERGESSIFGFCVCGHCQGRIILFLLRGVYQILGGPGVRMVFSVFLALEYLAFLTFEIGTAAGSKS